MSNSTLSIGIVGLPNVGKSTLFNALLKRQAALAANYPFATIEPNVGIVDVPDERIAQLVKIVKDEYSPKNTSSVSGSPSHPQKEIPEKTVPAVVKFYDIAGLVEGAHKGEGLGNQFLSHIREVNAILHVVRNFEDENVIRAGATEPEKDRELVNTELMLADIQTIERRMQAKSSKSEMPLLERIKQALEQGRLVNSLDLTDEEKQYVKELSLLTQKPMLYILNVDEEGLKRTISEQKIAAPMQSNSTTPEDAASKTTAVNFIPVSAKVEAELAEFDENERKAYLKELGVEESGLDRVIKECYKVLGLQTFFTAGPKEVHAWTIKKGAKAPQAAGEIHTDFEKGFIKAEVVSFNDLISSGGWKKAREAGLLRLEGKDYVMHDGDIVEFRFNV